MIKKTIICDRCGAEITEEHPTRIQVQEYSHEPSSSYGKKEKGYTTVATKHLCNTCDYCFKSFMTSHTPLTHSKGVRGGDC